jgi:peptidoglycan/LPS O-acetylase OafA/YrhL
MAEALVPQRVHVHLRAHPVAHVAYRAEIDGLRAVAVLSVLLFHARLGPFTGGFIGVDIFFVISGFLITQLITEQCEQNRFSFLYFYERRIRRLFPALFVMICATLVVAAFLFLPPDFRAFGRNVIGVMLFASNIFFFKQTDYFDGPAEVKPLLHTWSLGVEEQFYILFPLLLVFLLRKRRETAIMALGLLAATSLVACVLVLPISTAAAFYLTPFRIWELLIGSLLALGAVPQLHKPFQRAVVSALGIGCILFAALFFSRMTNFPGLAALVPTIGAALIIHAESNGLSPVGRLLASPAAVFTGKISYSLYLWHWPIIVFGGYYLIHELSTLHSLGMVSLSFGLATLSWHFIEVPFRKARTASASRLLFGVAAAGIACAALTGMLIYSSRGLPHRFSREVDALSSYSFSMNPKSDKCGDVDLQLAPSSPCTIGDPARATQFLWGDSHAGALFGAMNELSRAGAATIYGATPRCPPLIGIGTDPQCIRANDRKLNYVLSHPEIRSVIIAARWSLYVNGRATKLGPAETNGSVPQLETRDGEDLKQFSEPARREFRRGLEALISRLLASGKKVVLVYPIPETGYDVPSTLARLRYRGEDPAGFTTPLSAYNERQAFVLEMLDSFGSQRNLMRVYPQRVLCRGRRCLTSIGGKPLYFDSHHLSIPGSELLVPQLKASLADQPAPIARRDH